MFLTCISCLAIFIPILSNDFIFNLQNDDVTLALQFFSVYSLLGALIMVVSSAEIHYSMHQYLL